MFELRRLVTVPPEISDTRQPLVASISAFSTVWILPAVDFLAILVIPCLNSLFGSGLTYPERSMGFWVLLAVCAVLLVQSHGGYGRANFSTPRKSAGLAVRAYIVTCIAMLAVALLLGHQHAVNRYWTTAELSLTPAILLLARRSLPVSFMSDADSVLGNGPLVICYDRYPSGLNQALVERNIFSPVAGALFLSDRQNAAVVAGVRTIPDMAAFRREISQTAKDVIFIYQPDAELVPDQTQVALLVDAFAHAAHVWLAVNIEPQFPDFVTHRAGQMKLLEIGPGPLVSARNVSKRLFDIVVGTLLLIFALPAIAIIAGLVRASGRGPVVFRQRRIGAKGKDFCVLKFRTMTHDADRPFRQAERQDKRVTWIGSHLRRWSLDELLQLINVIKGDMSLVGPRPHAPETEVSGINFQNAVKLYGLRHRVKPGMTGLAQIRGQRGATKALATLESRIASDLEYIETWSLLLDVLILCKTIPALFSQHNAY